MLFLLLGSESIYILTTERYKRGDGRGRRGGGYSEGLLVAK
jgi:hypothetical protein